MDTGLFHVMAASARCRRGCLVSVYAGKSFTSQPDKSTILIESHHHNDCHKQADNNATDHLSASLPCDDTSCDAYSNTPIVSDYTAPMLANNTSDVSTLNSGFISFVPEQLQRPPLTAFP